MTRDINGVIDVFELDSVGYSECKSFVGPRISSTYEKIALNRTNDLLAIGGYMNIYFQPISAKGRPVEQHSMMHDGEINGIDFNPFQNNEIATISDDLFGYVWERTTN